MEHGTKYLGTCVEHGWNMSGTCVEHVSARTHRIVRVLYRPDSEDASARPDVGHAHHTKLVFGRLT